jgi:hypothetical protein
METWKTELQIYKNIKTNYTSEYYKQTDRKSYYLEDQELS